MYCANCGKELPEQSSFCPSCGHPAAAGGPGAAAGGLGAAAGGTAAGPRTSSPGATPDKAVSPHSRLAALLLCIFLGGLGVHRFYVGKIGTGVAMIFTLGGVGIWVLIDLIMVITGGFTDINGKYVLDWQV
jgi:TM2 domain-containing membrane protein YozV